MTSLPDITFLALGESLVDLISDGMVSSLEDAPSFHRFAGGQAANVALNMARLGIPSALGSCVGQDGFGRYLQRELSKANVLTDYIQITDQAPTTLVPVSRQTQTPDFILYRGADQHLQLTTGLKKAVIQARAVHTSAFALSHQPARDTIVQLLEKAYQAGKLISLDPNYHPRLHPDHPDFNAFLEELYPLVTVTKPSLDDGARIFGQGLSPQEILDHFLALGPEMVVLTMGGKGALIGTAAGEKYHLHANPISIGDVTGAGDAFWAGLLAGLLDEQPLVDASRLSKPVSEFKNGQVRHTDD